MGDRSLISWTDATWNWMIGCKRRSKGCDHCYAFEMHDRRFAAWRRGTYPTAPKQFQQPFRHVQIIEERLELPLRWTKPRRIFVNSLSDMFYGDEQDDPEYIVPDEILLRAYDVMARTPQHTYQILTKRTRRMQQWLRKHLPNPPANVWHGTSIEDQEAANLRVYDLLLTPGSVRFVSLEPLLGPVDLRHIPLKGQFTSYMLDALAGTYSVSTSAATPFCFGMSTLRPINWGIVGGESGPHYRPMARDEEGHLVWAESLRDQFVAARVPFYFKQVDGLRPGKGEDALGRVWHQYPDGHGGIVEQ